MINDDPKQLVANAQQAAAVSGLKPLLPQQVPNRIFAYKDWVILDYGGVIIYETVATGSFDIGLDGQYMIGTAAGGPLHVLPGSGDIRWRQDGIDIEVRGSQLDGSQTDQMVNLARQIAPDLTLPDPAADLVGQAIVKLPEDLAGTRADQLQEGQNAIANAETSPLYVAFVFVNSKLSPPGTFSAPKPTDPLPPDGIPRFWSGTPKIPNASFNPVANNGTEAVVAVADGQIRQVYLRRLIRQDETGVWSVVGYDPR